MTNTIASLFDSHGAVVFFDTETTGLKADEHQIIELAAIRVERSGSGGCCKITPFGPSVSSSPG